MTNGEHSALLKQGVDAWNTWRKENPWIRPELSSVNFSLANLNHINLRWANFSKANLRWANLKSADLRWANLFQVNLSRANLSLANLSRIDLRWAEIKHADLSQAILRWANISCANLSQATLIEADLRDTDLSLVNLSGANLSGADLRSADLSGANLSGANLSGANLAEVKLFKTQALGTNFNQAILAGACLQDWTTDSETNLDQVVYDAPYLYMNQHEDPSDDSDFTIEEFVRSYKQSLEAIDLIFSDGIDWEAFLLSFQDLQDEYGQANLSIRAIEDREDATFLIRLNIAPDVDKTQIESQAKEFYEARLSQIESRYRDELDINDEEIAIHWKQSADLIEIVKLQAQRTLGAHAHQTNGHEVEPPSSEETPKKSEVKASGLDAYLPPEMPAWS